MTVRAQGLRKSFADREGDVVALDELSLEVRDGELLVVVGPSGSGKTTLLRCIAGLEKPDSGSVAIGDRDVTEVPPGDRDIAMVFQEYALFPHLSARRNISFGLEARKVPKPKREAAVQHAARMLGLEDALDRRPGELSGGQRQRVALARAIVREPALFLMDEPLSNLDAELRTQTRSEIRRLQRELGTTTIYVTHDQVEAMTMGDRVAVLNRGRLEQVGPPLELYDAPATAFVAGFLGTPPMNLFSAELIGLHHHGAELTLGVRPERIRLGRAEQGRVTGIVEAVEAIGHEALVHLAAGGQRILARMTLEQAPAEGDDAGITFLDEDVHRFDAHGMAVR